MSKAKVLELLDAILEADKRDIEDYNNDVSWRGYSIDRHLSLTAFRLNRLAGGVIEALRELAMEEKPDLGGAEHG